MIGPHWRFTGAAAIGGTPAALAVRRRGAVHDPTRTFGTFYCCAAQRAPFEPGCDSGRMSELRAIHEATGCLIDGVAAA
jgi:hypothetical protein